MFKFVESKTPNYQRISQILDKCTETGQWANRGPVYESFREATHVYAHLPDDVAVVPCANAGLALEGMARRLSQQADRSLRWVVSAFSFRNIGRGYFTEALTVDCDNSGLLDTSAVAALDSETWDGMIIVNPFGLAQPSDLTSLIELGKSLGKHILIDNAAGFGARLPDWPWQSISFHHTKPYGVGEGGLAIVPVDQAEPLYELFNYGVLPEPPSAWLNNCKISDVSCAFLLDRLERASDWVPAYLEQAERVDAVAIGSGLRPLFPLNPVVPAMSRAYVAEVAFPLESLFAAKFVCFGKYYQPVADLPSAQSLYARILNIPAHPDMARLGENAFRDDICRVIENASKQVT